MLSFHALIFCLQVQAGGVVGICGHGSCSCFGHPVYGENNSQRFKYCLSLLLRDKQLSSVSPLSAAPGFLILCLKQMLWVFSELNLWFCLFWPTTYKLYLDIPDNYFCGFHWCVCHKNDFVQKHFLHLHTFLLKPETYACTAGCFAKRLNQDELIILLIS